ncbi:MAG: hypothetical protein QOC81_237 [Thermoanaerobaculia bacterium]|nr:hypothetical protein [Thermoanaerobaculia bacterium]
MGALIVAEIVLSMTWNRFYFTTGIPIFWRRIESTEKLETLSLEALQKASATAAGAPFAFRPLTPNAIAFRERPLGGMMHYMPLMRGLIRIQPRGAVHLRARFGELVLPRPDHLPAGHAGPQGRDQRALPGGRAGGPLFHPGHSIRKDRESSSQTAWPAAVDSASALSQRRPRLTQPLSSQWP